MQIKQVWNNKIAKDWENFTYDEQSKYYRMFKKQFDALSDYNDRIANELFYQYIEETIILACSGDVIAQDFLAYIYKKGWDGVLTEPRLSMSILTLTPSFAFFVHISMISLPIRSFANI